MFNPKIPVNVSKLRQIAAKANDNTINLTVGNPIDDFPIELIPALSKLNEQALGYSKNQGSDLLRSLIGKHYGFLNEEVVVTNGAQGGLMCALMALIDPENGLVAIPNPGFLAYPTMVEMLGGVPLYYNYQKDKVGNFHLSVDYLKKQIPNNCRVVLINTPSNPTCHAFSTEELVELSIWAEENNKFLLIDEVYGELNYLEKYTPKNYSNPYVISVSSLSKSHSLAGSRLGWLLSPNKELISKVTVVNQYFNTCASSLAQSIGVYLFDNSGLFEGIRDRYRTIYQNKLKMFFSAFDGIKTPSFAFYGFLKTPENFSHSSEEFVSFLLEKNNILAVPGEYFGSEGKEYYRVSLAIEDEQVLKASEVLAKYY